MTFLAIVLGIPAALIFLVGKSLRSFFPIALTKAHHQWPKSVRDPLPDDPIFREGPQYFFPRLIRKEDAMPARRGTLEDADRLGIPRRTYVISSRPAVRPASPQDNASVQSSGPSKGSRGGAAPGHKHDPQTR
jgi:hypothetical protein